MEKIMVTIAPERDRTRVLVMSGLDEMMRAVLGPASQSHPRAAATLLEGLALWHQRALTVVLYVEGTSSSSGLELCDGLGFGYPSVHYEVGVAVREHRRRGARLGGLGDFRELRELSRAEGMR
jgi:hypothetical protein